MRAHDLFLAGTVVLAQLPPHTVVALQAVPQARPRALLSEEVAVAGTFILAATFFADQGLRTELSQHRTGTTRAMARIGNAFGDPGYVLPVLGAGFLAGRLTGSSRLSRTALRAGEAAAVAGGLATAVKLTVGRRRPGGDGDSDEFRPFGGWNSFPSGHTALAFAVATTLAEATPDPWTDAALYGLAGVTGFARLTDDRHWLSDVFTGAVIGHLSARWVLLRHGRVTSGPGAISASIAF